jgi:DnaJ-class molecular chaperone
MDSFPDYYAALRVEPAATQQEIARAYRTLMRTHHPDVDGGGAVDGTAVDREAKDNELLMIMQAFSVLRDPARRAAYDRSIPGRKESRAASHNVPVRKVHSQAEPSAHTIRITPVRWESGPWA